jgi:membrane protease YdiL (CAAX protease family)
MEAPQRSGNVEIALRVSVYAFLALISTVAISTLILWTTGAYVLGASLGTFGGAIIANALAIRIYERGGDFHLISMAWNPASRRNLSLGIAGGVGAALLVLVPPLVVGAAELHKNPENPGGAGQLAFLIVVLMFGAVGEEMLFRGYGFQTLIAHMGPFATILPLGVLFGAAHTNNENASLLSLVNTVAWGIVLGYAFLRSGDLWLPIGLHYGWNIVLPLFGTNLSGFTMGVTGYAMQWNIGDLWSGGAYGPEAGLPTLLALGAVIFFIEKAPLKPQIPPLIVGSREV